MFEEEKKIIDGNLFKQMIINGTLHLKNNHEIINNLNVFPVPDGDTGTNMQMTMMEGVKKLSLTNDCSIIEVAKILNDALLIGSKGNSGVILSQFFSGIYEQIKIFKKKEINIEEFIQSLVSGYKKAYDSILEPVEGTILTVLRESIEKVKEKKRDIHSIKKLIQELIKYSKISLNNTPYLLDVLKQSNVVDSGGAGFISFLEGISMYLNNIPIKEIKKERLSDIFSETEISHNNLKETEIKYNYCTEMVIKLFPNIKFNKEEKEKEFSSKGDSLILIKKDELIKIHIHTNHPEFILNNLSFYGELVKCKIDNMKEQNKNIVNSNNQKKANKDEYVIISVFSGKEVQSIFKELKVDYLINNKKEDSFFEDLRNILSNLEREKNKNIIILPNNKQMLFKTIQLTKKYSELKIHIIKTENIAQGYSALLAFDENLSLKENLTNMKVNIQKNKIGEITYANKINTEKYNKEKDNFLALLQGKVVDYHKDLIFLAKKLLKQIITSKNNFLTIFYHKKPIFEKQLSQLEFFVEKQYPHLEIEKIKNDNHLSPYILILE
ncbi:DAK2 domain-containing protein [Texas Phoenix palm phytoplasma]|uniref:DAK2 domain-containing protein n=1 Tax=Texas Phoenix palm phytoplasma TaxID=176709 RepID=A0ABS5BIS7_9MOLU|nr:DAK2 domain-containing protein [Texas Phoenix palm phytoplasma]MBP3059500.1 DAK2 domain-containing protein [Texas Phoenix palm phytoplasma]